MFVSVMWLKAYENIKCRSKKALANDRVQRLRTGGGSFISQVDPVEEKVATLLGNRARPLTNCYDSDATYCDDTGMFIIHISTCTIWLPNGAD